jgi:hypothetical protein
MGYTTKFDGQFRMNKLPSDEVIAKIRELEGIIGEDVNNTSITYGYCQWQLTKDCQGIEWDGREKFYQYVEWLEHILTTVLIPNDITLSGIVYYSGEEVKDSGVIVVQDNQVIKYDVENILELLKEFVLKDIASNLTDKFGIY